MFCTLQKSINLFFQFYIYYFCNVLKNITCLLLLIAFIRSSAQDEFGISNSLYAPTKTVLHNPTNTLDNKTWLDIHLVGLGTFVHNDYLYMKGYEFSFFNNIILGQQWPDFHFNTSGNLKSALQDSDVELIGGAFQYKQHGFALNTRVRTFFDFRRIPVAVAKLLSDGAQNYTGYYDQVFSAKKAFMNQMSYTEIAASYSNMVYHFDKKSIGAGITFKYLIGITGAAAKLNELEYNIVDPNNTYFFNFDGSIGYAAGFGSGKGIAVDLGGVYKKTLDNVTFYEPYSENAACLNYDYKWKLAAAIIDLGYINYSKDATRYDLKTTSTLTNTTGEEFNYNSFGEFAANEFDEATETNKFRMLTPAALNLQADYNFENNFYASGQLMYGFFRRNAFGVKRENVLAISGRYQTKFFEGSLVGSLYQYQQPRIGLALRFLYLTIGTDNLWSMTGIPDFYGTDIYFNLRFFLTKRPGCRNEQKKKNLNETKCIKN